MGDERDDEATAAVAKWPVATVVEIRVMGVFPASLYAELQGIADRAEASLRELACDAGGRDFVRQWAEVRAATREEVLHFQPRKVHYRTHEQGGKRWACSTQHVATRNLTNEREKVTCKLCRVALGIAERP